MQSSFSFSEHWPVLTLFVLLLLVVLSLYNWLDAKADEAAERARRLKLENDMKELDIEMRELEVEAAVKTAREGRTVP